MWHGLVRARKATIKCDYPYVSVIIAARNESHDIENCLDALLVQDYPQHKFEIIVVNDQSTDCTREQLDKFSKNERILILQNPGQENFKSSKKAALALGISKSKGNILLFTDADCKPPPSWITVMLSFFDASTGLVAGFSPQTTNNTMLAPLLQIDAAAAALVSAASIGLGRGITCTGRNLAYRKQAYMDVGGFAETPNSLSGDDDFMLQAISHFRRWKVRYAFEIDAVVPAQGPNSLKAFLRQKQRHISASKYYPLLAKILFASYHFLNLFLWLTLLLACIRFYFFFAFAAKMCVDYFLLKSFLTRFAKKINFKAFLMWELLFLYYNVIIGPIALIKKIEW